MLWLWANITAGHVAKARSDRPDRLAVSLRDVGMAGVVADGLGTLQLGMEAFAIRDRVVARQPAEASAAAPSCLKIRLSRSRSRSLLDRNGQTRDPRFEPTLFSLVSELTIKRPSSSDRLSRCGERIVYRLARGCQSSPGNRRSIGLLRMTHVTQSDEGR